MSIVKSAALASAILLCVSGLSTATAQQQDRAIESDTAGQALRISTWGGAYGQAQERALLAPIRDELGVKIDQRTRTTGLSDANEADILEVDQVSLFQGCRSGAFAPLGQIDLAPAVDGEPTADDFVDGGISKCGVASFAWSSLVLVDLSAFKKRKPDSLADVFDTKRFRGKRAFPKQAERLLEMLVMANGVAIEDVYSALNDRKTVDDAFARLEKLLPSIVWVSSANQAVQELESGRVRFALGYSGRAFRKTVAGNLSAIWDKHIYDYGSWVISAKARDKELARKFIVLATAPKHLAAQARLWPYGPMRKSAAAQVGRHDLLDIELAPFMPTSVQRLSNGLRRNGQFWSENASRLNDRLAALLEGYPKGIRVPPPQRAPEPPPRQDEEPLKVDTNSSR